MKVVLEYPTIFYWEIFIGRLLEMLTFIRCLLCPVVHSYNHTRPLWFPIKAQKAELCLSLKLQNKKPRTWQGVLLLIFQGGIKAQNMWVLLLILQGKKAQNIQYQILVKSGIVLTCNTNIHGVRWYWHVHL